MAVIEWTPTDSVDVENVATPPLRVPVPSTAEPSMKLTVPVGVPLPGDVAFNVAVKVTFSPYTEGFNEEVSFVVVLACVDRLAQSSRCAGHEIVVAAIDDGDGMRPAPSELVAKVARPLLSGAVSKLVEPSMNVTVPVGVPLPGAAAFTVAVKVNDWP